MIQEYKDITESVDVLPFGDSAGVPIQDIFVPLLMEEDLATKERLHRPDVPRGKTIEHIKDLFYVGDKTADRIFIKGEAGSGKTLFSIKLLDAWCQTKQSNTGVNDELQECMSVFDLVFYIPLRHVPKGITCVKDMVQKFVSPNCKDQLGNISTHCLLIMDGLDEWPSPKGYTELPKMTGLVNCTLICTMRPWKLAQLKIKFKPHDKIVQLLGLKPQSVETLITHVLCKFYRLKIESEEFKSKLLRYVSMTKQSVVQSLIEMPMMLTTFCCMWCENDIFNEKVNSQIEQGSNYSMTVSYLSLLEAMIRRTDDKHDLRSFVIDDRQTMLSKVMSYMYLVEIPKIPTILKAFPYINKYINTLLPLSRLAYNDLVTDDTKLVFQKHQLEVDVGHKVINLALKVGLINQVKAPGKFLKENVSINFYHKSIQEFVAALHLSCGTSGGIVSFCGHLPSVSKVMEQANMIRFVMGLDPTDDQISKHVTSIMHTDSLIPFYRVFPRLYYDKFNVIYRAQCQWYREITHSLKLTNVSLPPCIISVTDVCLDNDSDNDAVMVTSELMQTNKENIVSVILRNVKYPVRHVIQWLPQCTKLSALNVLVTSEEDHDQLVMVLPNLTSLDTIDYTGHSSIPVPSQSAAVHAIIQLKQIKWIYLSDVDLGDDTVVLTRDMTRLERLELCSVNMSVASWNRFVTGLHSIEHPVQVALWNTNIDDDTVRMIQSSFRYIVTTENTVYHGGQYVSLQFRTCTTYR